MATIEMLHLQTVADVIHNMPLVQDLTKNDVT